MMWYVFPLLIIDDMSRLLQYIDVCLAQLPPFVILVYEWAKLVERYFYVQFGFEEVIYICYIAQREEIIFLS